MLDVWVISVGIFFPMRILRRGDISLKLIIQSFFPTILGNNWYITCYLLFLLLCPYLNSLLEKMEQQELLRVTVFLTTVYMGIGFIKMEVLFPSNLVFWITIYFSMAYMKRYLEDFAKSAEWNIYALLIGVFGNLVLFLATDFLGLFSSLF